MDKDYREKIKKLLALAESPNENEAKAALLKARELMVEHKLTEADCIDIGKRSVKTIDTGFSFSRRRNPWTVELATVIGENYCCKAVRLHIKGKQTNTIQFIGLDEDAEICSEIFRYAMECVLTRTAEIKRENKDIYYPKYVRRLADSYGAGFVVGLAKAYHEQDTEKTDETGWALAVQLPAEVQEEIQDIPNDNYNGIDKEKLTADEFYSGYDDGQKFNPERRLKAV